MIKISRKYFSLLFLLSFITLPLFAYNSTLIEKYEIDKNENVQPGLYSNIMNPAFYSFIGVEDNSIYKVSYLNEDRAFYRLYDAKSLNSNNISFSALKNLDSKSLLIASIYFSDSYYNDVYNSLEKDHYNTYYAFTDTTTGSFHYSGPQIAFTYSRNMLKYLYWGTDLHYGIETGLKDVYTQSESIFTNTDISTGFGLTNKDKTLFIGSFLRYISYQGKYESVKEYHDAITLMYFGYHLFGWENPGSTVTKSEYIDGINFGVNFYKKSLIFQDLNLLFSYIDGEQYSVIKAGSSSKPITRGATAIREKSFLFALDYSPEESRFSHSFVYEYSTKSDWAKSGLYDVLILENEESSQTFSLDESVKLGEKLKLRAATLQNVKSLDYKEYNFVFSNKVDLYSQITLMEIQYKLNALIELKAGFQLSSEELDYHWNSTKKNGLQYLLGVERLSPWGIIGINLKAEKQTFDAVSGNNKVYFTELYLR